MVKKRLLGKKIGMTTLFTQEGACVACTVVEILPHVVLDKKSEANDGYQSLVLAANPIEASHERTRLRKLNKSQNGLFKKQNVRPHKRIFESSWNLDASIGDVFTIDLIKDLLHVDVTATSKGKGYQGLMKKNNFRGGPAAHGSGFHRHAGSTGQRSTPGRCFKGSPRPSQMGNEIVTVQSLRVEKIDENRQLLLLRGAVPGANGSAVFITPAVKKSLTLAA